jgi:hypothetical protein
MIKMQMYKTNINILHVLLAIIISLNASVAFASVVTLSWDAPTANADGTTLTDLAGYKVYYCTSSGDYSEYIDVGNVLSYMVSDLENGFVYYFAVTAYDTSGNESEYSNDVSGVAKSILECDLIPDATVIPRGGTLGFQAIVTNYTDESATVVLASQVTYPDGTEIFLIDPLDNFFEPYQSKSWHKTHYIPLTAPLGIYTYHGYVGNYGMGIYDECWFNFEVIP